MPTTSIRERQERWNEIVTDPHLGDLPYKIETNVRGQILLTPRTARHSARRGNVIDLLAEHAPDGLIRPGVPICTDNGIKIPSVVWITEERRDEMRETGDPPTIAPEICVEVMSESNDWEEMHEKRALYRNAGAEEVWIVDRDDRIRFFQDEERDASALVPSVPSSL